MIATCYTTVVATFNLKEHLAREHKRTPFSQYVREITYGGNDGIITAFAVVAAFAGAHKDVSSSIPIIAVLLFGLANLFADGLSMSLGSFLSLRAERDVYRSEKNKESHEIVHEPEREFEETVTILQKKGYNKTDATAMAFLYRKNPAYWTEFMMKDELEMPNPEGENPWLIAISTFTAFVIFGAIPLLPYIFDVPFDTFQFSIATTAMALLLLGYLRSTVSQRGAFHTMSETLIIGGVAAGVAYVVGTFFRI